MRFSRARYVTLCQQSLVTAAVLALGVSAAGVKTLDIVPQPGTPAGAQGVPPQGFPQQTLAQPADEPPAKTKVDAAPVTPKVREVRVTGIAASAPGADTSADARRRTTAPATQAPTQTKAHTQAPTQAATPKAKQAAPATKRLVALSEPQAVTGYATVGVTWKHGVEYSPDQLTVQVRMEDSGKWSTWRDLDHDTEDGPDSDSSEMDAPHARPGTGALVVGDVDRVQMRAETTDGSLPPDLRLAVIDPGTGKMVKAAPAIDTSKLPATPQTGNEPDTSSSSGTPQASGSGEVQDTVALSAMKRTVKPYIYSRAQWGANERMREQSRPSYGTVKTGFIHHTVNANSYTSEQVPALLRGIYAYHTQSRGWRDIGYNYLVDRFGRIWEGRYGGVGSPVVGAHTLGYNEVSFAMSAIGNYDIAAPPEAVLNAFARLFAWKLSLYNIRADASRVYVKNRWLRGINGHRDVGQTACPGRYLYAKLPAVRVLAQRVQNAAQSGTAPPATPPPATPPPAPNPDAFTSPTQTPKAPTLQPTIAFPRTLNLAGDSNPDLVLKAPTGVVRVLPLGGQIGLRYGGSTKGPWSGMDQIVAVGDVNGDGRGDVLGRTRSDRTTRVYRGDGVGHVSLPGVGATKVFRYADMITAAGDWNRDGHNDVLMRDTATGWLWMVPGLGTGKFGTPVLLSKSWKSFTATAVAGDLTGDGRPDIVGIHRNGYVYAAASTTTGRLSGFSRRQYVGKTYDAILGGGRSMTADSYGDILLRSSSNGRVILLPGKRGGFGPPLGPFDQSVGMRRLSAGQMVLGAQPDLVGTDASGTHLLVYANNGQTNLRALLPSNLTRADASQVLNVGDWNRDGRGDVITRQSGGDALVLRPGLGNGGFGNGIVMSRGWKSFTNLAAVGDITGDKAPDLVGKSRTGKTTIFPGNGSRSFKAPVVAANYLKSFNQVGTGWWKSQLFPATAFLSSDGSFVPFMGTGAGDLGAYNWVIGPGDVDGDQKNDLIGRDARGTLWLLPGTTNGYGTRRVIATGFSGYSLGG